MPRTIAFLALLALAAVCLGPILAADDKPAASPGKDRVFEMRTYYTLEGRLPALNKRFREHTCDLFKKHGMDLIGFWTPIEEKDGKNDKLVYILAYPSREAADASWKAFRTDPDWIKAQRREREGRQDRQEGRVGLPQPDRLQPDQVSRAEGPCHARPTPPLPPEAPEVDDIRAASERLAPWIHRTP